MFKKLWDKYDGTEEGLYIIVNEVLATEFIWKMDLNKIEGLTDAVARALISIEEKGMKKALQEMV